MMTTAIRVLYVDDESDLLDISKLFLEESGDFTVTTALSAPEGILLLEQEKFDAIISDYQMPGMDGIQFLVEVRKRFGPIPFILFTGRGREEIVIQAINSGADFYLQKGGEPGAQFAELTHKIKQAALRNRAENSLRKSEEKYRHLIEHSNEAIIVAQDGMLKLVNHRLIELLGYSEQELLSTPFPVFIHPDDRAMVMERYQKRLKCEEFPSRYPFRLNPKDGNLLWVEISAVVIDWDGRPATLNFLTDITERKQADDSLREEQQFSKLLLDSLPGIFYLYTYPENRMVRWNKQHETLLGYTADEIKGKLGTDLHLPEYKDAVLKAIDEVMEKGQSSVESTLLAKDGRLIPFFFTGVRFETPGQLYFMGIGIDITERKKAEEALIRNTEDLHSAYEELTASEEELRQNVEDLSRSKRELSESEEKFRVIADYTVNWESWFGTDGKYIWVSPSVARFTGYTQVEILTMPDFISTVIAKEDRAMFTERFREAIQGTSGENFEFRYIHRNGTKYWLNVSWQPIVDMNGNSFGTRASGHDITGRVQAEEALRISEEKYRKAFFTSPNAICITRFHDGRFISINKGFTEITGYTEEDVIGKTSLEINIWKDPEDRRKIVQGLQAYGEVRNYEARFLTKTGEIYGSMSTSVIELNGVPHILNITHDITERKLAEEALLKKTEELNASYVELTASEEELRQNVDDLSRTEQALRESEEKFHSLYLHMIEGAALHELTYNDQGIPEDYIIIETNPAFERKLGISRDAVIGKTSREAYGLTEPPFLEIYARVALTGEPEIFETYFPPLAKHFSISTYSPGKGRFATIFEDITERKLAEEALKKSEERFRLTLDAINDGIWDWDIPTGTAFFSPRWYTMLGYAPDEMPGSYATWRSLIHPEDIGPAEQIIQDHTGRRDGGYRVEFRMRTKDGNWKWILTRGLVVEWDADNKPVRMVGTHTDITERKRAEEAIISAQQRLKEAHRLAHIGTWDWVIETDTVTWSEELCNISGWDPSLPAPTYTELPRIYTAASWERLSAAVTRALTNGEPYNLELEMIRPDGSIRWINAFGGVQRDGDGKVIGLHGTVQDITERKHDREALIRSEKLHRTILQTIAEGFWIVDSKGKVLDVNETYCRMSGYTRAELLNLGITDLDTLEEPTETAERIQRIIVIGSEIFETSHRRKDGSVFEVEVSTTYLNQNGGKFVCFCRDITDRKRAEDALRETNEYLNNLFDYANAPIIVWDQNFVITRFNHAFEDLTLISAQEIIGQRLDILFPKDSKDTSHLQIKKTLEGERWEIVEIPILVKDGSIRTLLWNSANILDPDGRIISTIAQGVDITESKQAEAALAKSFALFKTILDSLDALVYVADMKTHEILFVNQYGRKIFGDITGKICWKSIQVDQKGPCPFCTNKKLLDSDGNPTGILIWEFKNTINGHWYECHDSAIRWTDGRIVRIEIATDITDRKQVDEVLRESEERFRGLFDTITSGVAIYEVRNDGASGKDYIIKDFNKTALEIEGKTKYEVLGRSLFDLRPAIDEYGLIPVFKKVWETGVPAYFPQKVYVDEKYSNWYENRVFRLQSGEIVAVYDDVTERKRAEETLRESEERYNSLFTNNYSISLLIDPESGMIVDANAAACKYYGYSPEQIRGMGIYEINRIEKERVIRNLKEAKTEKERHFYSTHFLSDGEWRNVEIYSGPILVNGKTLFYSIIHDVTDRVKAEEELKNSRLFIEHTLTTTPALIYIYDVVEQRNVYTNRGILETLGYTPEEISSMGQDLFSKILHPEDAGLVGQHHARFSSLPDSTVAEIEYRMKHADGSWRWLHSRDTVFQRTPDGAVRQILGSSIDITDRKRAEEALKKSEEKYRMLIEQTDEGVWIVGSDYKTTFVNSRLAAMFGYTPQEMIGKQIREFMPADDTEMHNRRIKERMEGKGDRFEQKFLRKDGSALWVIASVTPLLTEENRFAGAFAMLTDITERKRAEDTINTANRKLNLLSSITRHDINNQMTALRGYTTMLQRKQPDSSFAEYFQKINAAAERISSMIRFTKEYESIGVTAPVWQDCRTLVDTAAKQAQLGQIIVKNDLPAGTEVFADPLVVKVFYNLMDNAMRHGGKITTIRFSDEEHDGEHVVVCEDDGNGIIDMEKKKIFGRGFGKNTGMGLFLSREILDITGLTITETGEPGKGARFEMAVPKGAWRMTGTGT